MPVKNYQSTSENAIPWSFILGSEDNHKRIIEEYLKKYSLTGLAIHFGVSRNGMKNKVEKEGIEKRKMMMEKINELGDIKNLTAKEISKITGCNSKSIVRLCKKYNIPYKKVNPLNNLNGYSQRKEKK